MRIFPKLVLSVCLLGLLASCQREKPENKEKFSPFSSGEAGLKPPPGDNISQGLWWLYHLQYDQSRKLFGEYIQSNPKDPLGYFYRTAVDWWELAQDIELPQPEIESRFERNYKETVRVAQASLKRTKNSKTRAVALLCEGGAVGLRGRWFVTKNDWTEAYSLGKRGYKLLKQSLTHDPKLYDAYLGLGIYDYYTATLPGVMGFLAKMVMHGDRERGIEELHRTIEKAKYARVEAALFLIQINTSFENKPEEALALARQLRKEYPNSPVMHVSEINALFEAKNWTEEMLEAKKFIEKCQEEIPYYSRSSLQTGYYFAGMGALFGKKDAKGCLRYMNQIISERKKPSQWVSFAYLRRGQAYDLLGKRALAIADYKTVLSRKDVWNTHKYASDYLKDPFSMRSSTR